jgi:hypothetical protein
MKNVPRKHAKMQWVQDPNQSSVDNLKKWRCEAGRHFRKKKEEAKIDEFESNDKIKTLTLV